MSALEPDRCEMILLVQAEFDGELDAAQAAHLAAHRTQCPVCQTAEAELARSREIMRSAQYEPMPDAVRQRILARLDAARPQPGAASAPARPRQRSWRFGTIGFGIGAACAAALALVILSPAEQSLTEQVVAGHVRALQPGHLADVASSDQHTVKPWFDGRIDFAPPVKDLRSAGFPLQGGRLDYIGGRPVAALVYQRDKHVIDLYVWPATGELAAGPESTERNGYNVVHWSQNGMNFWAVSDVEQKQLREFAAELQRAP
jgi:anti-sigma factor RsiW